MDIQKTINGDQMTLALSGRLDTATSPQLQNMLIPAFDEAKQVVIDFAKLAYVSSAGLRVLLMGEKTAKAKSGSMTLTHVSAEIMEVFEMTGFTGVLHIE